MGPTLLLALLTAAGSLTVLWAIRPALFPEQLTAVDERMQYYGTDVSRTDEVARLSFRERIIQPALDGLAAGVTRLTPGGYLRRVEERLELAGRPSGLGAVGFILIRAAAALLGAALGFVLGTFFGPLLYGLVAACVLALGAWILLGLVVGSLIDDRRHQIEIALPNLIDFLVISVTAGLTLDRALTRIVAQFDNPLTRGLAVTLTEVQLGRPRLEALEAYGKASGVPAVHNFIQALTSSERMGVPLADILRVQAEAARWRRSDQAARLGASAPVKMTIPMVIFIFPTIWIVLLGPALLTIFKGGL